MITNCLWCQKDITTYPSRVALGYGKYCSKSCAAKAKNGTRCYKWNGGYRITSNGYKAIWIAPQTYILEHRLIMEKYLGRSLLANEVVHHKDGNKLHNALENLELHTKATHAYLHKRMKHKWAKDFAQCINCGTKVIRHNAHGMCMTCYKYWWETK